MDFLKSVRASIYGPEYYASLREKPLSYSIKYFIVLTAWLAVIAATVLLFSVIPSVNTFLANVSAKVVDEYPSELRITVEHGKVSTNVPEPYFLKLPDELKTSSSSQSDVMATSTPENLLVIDTKDPFTVDEFNNDQTLLLLTGDSVAYEKNGGIVVQPIGADQSFDVNKENVTSFFESARAYFKIIDCAIALLIPIGLFLVMASRLVYLFILALLVWAIARIKKIKIGYGQAYRWGIHLMTLPLLLSAALWLLVPTVSIPFLFTIVSLVMTAVNLKSISATTSSHSSHVA